MGNNLFENNYKNFFMKYKKKRFWDYYIILLFGINFLMVGFVVFVV